ncbi:hypothetical protein AAMO2058_000213800 [Amorphochlora amoebiformis]
MSSEASARVALVCVMFAVLLTLCQIRLQIMWNSNPKMRKHVIRILLMVPIYAVQSYIALLLKDSFVYFDALRECYEAVVIYSFVLLLVGYLGGERHLVYVLELKPAEYVKHPFPFNYCVGDRVRLGKDYFQFTKIGALQYVVLKPLTAIASFILSATGTLGETDPFRFDRGYLYIVTINSISQALAIYCLLLFYTVMRTELQPLDFVSKAIVLKTVIFFTYWQSITFRLIALTNIIPLPSELYIFSLFLLFIFSLSPLFLPLSSSSPPSSLSLFSLFSPCLLVSIAIYLSCLFLFQ